MSCISRPSLFFFFFFNDTATTEIYTLSLHDALPISPAVAGLDEGPFTLEMHDDRNRHERERDRKSTRLNSSHANISYAVFCLKKKKKKLTAKLSRLHTPNNTEVEQR